MRTQNKILLLIVIILLLSIGHLNYGNFLNYSKDNFNNGQIKGIISKTENKNIQIAKIPQKKNNFNDPKIWADVYILIDRDSFYPLIEKNSQKNVPIASTTKIMTAIIALENYNLEEIVTVSQNAAAQIGSDIFLKTNEKITVNDLLYCLLIKSGNDSAMALAEHLTGNYSDFVKKMNVKADYLGLKQTEFIDPAGLDDNGHSTAHDLAVMAAYALKNKTFSEIVKISEATVTSKNGIVHKLENSNRLVKNNELLYYPSAIGVKTGYTPDAGHCLVAASQKNDHTLISVILNTTENTAEASAKESKKLLEWGYTNYEW